MLKLLLQQLLKMFEWTPILQVHIYFQNQLLAFGEYPLPIKCALDMFFVDFINSLWLQVVHFFVCNVILKSC
jgi:hypothetical protein